MADRCGVERGAEAGMTAGVDFRRAAAGAVVFGRFDFLKKNQTEGDVTRGGKRPGSGRPRGSNLAIRTRAVAERAAEAGPTPLEVMLEAMQAHRAAGRLDEAAEIASKAAPYVHPRLAAVQHSGAGVFDGMSLEALRNEVRRCLKERLGIGFDDDGRPVIEGGA